MRKYLLLFLFFSSFLKLQSQVKNDTIDSSYLEDQIYVALTYNILFNKPNGIEQKGFSGGFSIGFIKDLPFNKQRNLGIGLGVGYNYNAYIQNLKIVGDINKTLFELAENYSINRFGISSIEMPFELRWRTSTASKYKFWRIYTGVKFSYALTTKSKYSDENSTIRTKNISDYNKFQYGLVFSGGYSNWNLYLYYGLKPLFENNVTFDNQKLMLNEFNLGLKFYIM
ncbi:porin family protein [Lutibacter aestuarii]|uniref:Porin family protein n=2 Tax=Lutibacter TaxID=358023 RepID=A0ABW2Z127_9FLAO